MEKANYKHAETSSFTVDLFGPKDSRSNPPAAGFFGSIFAPPTSIVPGRDPLPQDFNGYGKVKHETTTDYKSEKSNPIKKENNSSYYNTSIYYGAQEVYSPTTPNTTPPHNFRKDGDQNESNSSGASRGNWWQGSLYY